MNEALREHGVRRRHLGSFGYSQAVFGGFSWRARPVGGPSVHPHTACRRDFKSHVIGLELGYAPVESDHLPAATLGRDETRAEGEKRRETLEGCRNLATKLNQKT